MLLQLFFMLAPITISLVSAVYCVKTFNTQRREREIDRRDRNRVNLESSLNDCHNRFIDFLSENESNDNISVFSRESKIYIPCNNLVEVFGKLCTNIKINEKIYNLTILLSDSSFEDLTKNDQKLTQIRKSINDIKNLIN